MDTGIDAAAVAAGRILAGNLTPMGMMASTQVYRQVWARDSVITFLGGALDRSPGALAGFKTTLATLAANRDRFGQIPALVHCADGACEFGSTDANPWFVIGAAHYVALSGDAGWLGDYADAVVAALDRCEAQDLFKSGLVVSPECGDWADLLSNRGHVLFPNVLYAAALGLAGKLLAVVRPEDARRFQAREAVVKAAIQDLFWVKAPAAFEDRSHHQVRKLMACRLRRRPYFLPWMGQFEGGEHFDTTANLLAILAGVASPEQTTSILDYIEQVGLNRPYPVRVLHPPIQPAEREWREYYKIFNLNLPHQYHNGGIWPWVGGLYVAALVRAGRHEAAARELELLSEAVHLGVEPWEFNEWLHGETGRPMGSRNQAWSAGMLLYARHAVRTGETPGFAAG